MTLHEFQKLKTEVERMKREEARLEGGLEHFYTQMEKLGLRDCREAEAALERLVEEKEEKKKQYEAALKKFREKWETNLGE